VNLRRWQIFYVWNVGQYQPALLWRCWHACSTIGQNDNIIFIVCVSVFYQILVSKFVNAATCFVCGVISDEHFIDKGAIVLLKDFRDQPTGVNLAGMPGDTSPNILVRMSATKPFRGLPQYPQSRCLQNIESYVLGQRLRSHLVCTPEHHVAYCEVVCWEENRQASVSCAA